MSATQPLVQLPRVGAIIFYCTEWQTAHRMREQFSIYDVQNALSAPRLSIVQDPVGKGIRTLERVIEYQISADQLAAVAEVASP